MDQLDTDWFHLLRTDGKLQNTCNKPLVDRSGFPSMTKYQPTRNHLQTRGTLPSLGEELWGIYRMNLNVNWYALPQFPKFGPTTTGGIPTCHVFKPCIAGWLMALAKRKFGEAVWNVGNILPCSWNKSGAKKTPTKDQALEGTILISQNIPETNINNYHWYHLTSLFKKHGNSKAFVSIGLDRPRS